MRLIREKQFKANLHCHSTLSDGRLTPSQLKEAYMERGYSVLAITDHERPHDHTAISKKGFLMLTGYEAYIRPDPAGRYNRWAPEVHLNLFAEDPHNTDLVCAQPAYVKYMPKEELASQKTVGSPGQRSYTPEYVNGFIRTAKEDGYIVAYNHPVWSLEDAAVIPEYEGCFSMEVFTFNSWQEGMEEYNGALYDALLRKGKRLYAHATDDNHNVHPFSHPGNDSFGGFTMICTEDGRLSYDRIIRALKSGTFYASSGPLILSLETDGKRVKVKTTPVEAIVLTYGSKTPRVARPEEEGGTVDSAVFDMPQDAPYFRIHLRGAGGKTADTRGYFRDEWENA